MNFLPVQYCTLCQWHLCTFVQAPRRTGSHRPSCTAAPPTSRTPPPPWSSTPSPRKRGTQLVLPESHLHGVALWHQHLLVYIGQNWNIRSDITRNGCWNVRPCTAPLLPPCTFPWMTDCTPKGNQYNTPSSLGTITPVRKQSHIVAAAPGCILFPVSHCSLVPESRSFRFSEKVGICITVGKTFLILWSRHFTFTKPHFSIHSSSDQQDSDNLRSILT